MTDSLRLDAVRIMHPARALIPALDVTVAPGECVTLMGPSGCGKSTLLAFISGALDPAFDASGRVLIGDVDITRLKYHPRCAKTMVSRYASWRR